MILKIICWGILFACLSIILINGLQKTDIPEEKNFSISPIRTAKTMIKIIRTGLTTLPKLAMWTLSIITICCIILITMTTGFVDYY